MLRDDEIDLAFLSVTERIQRPGLTLRPLVSEELVVVLAHRPRARRPRRGCGSATSPASRSSRFREGARLRELLDRAAAGAGFEPRIALESNESRRIRSLVSHGLGVAILPRSDAERPGRRGRGLRPRRAVADARRDARARAPSAGRRRRPRRSWRSRSRSTAARRPLGRRQA